MNKKLLLASFACALSLSACSNDKEASDKTADMNKAAKEMSEHADKAKTEMKEKMQEKMSGEMNSMKKALLTEAQLKAMEDNDKHRWLEEVEGEKALAWVEARNKPSLEYLQGLPVYKKLFDKNLAAYNSDERIEYPSFSGDYIYNFWRDEEHVRGISRRTNLDSYLTGAPEWETVVDVDAIAKNEDKNWVYKGNVCLFPDYTLCMLNLSDGGKDAVVRREYDLNKKAFVEGGFETHESKGSTAWLDKDHQLVGLDFGAGTLTDSGYPRISKLWKRGTPLSEAKTLFEGEQADVGIWPSVGYDADGRRYAFIIRSKTFYTSELFYLQPQGSDNNSDSDFELVKMDIPEDADFNGIFKQQMLVSLKTDWTVGGKTHKQGAMVSIGFDDFIAGKRDFVSFVEPTATSSISSATQTKDKLIVKILNNVSSELREYAFNDGKWSHSEVDAPKLGTLSVVASTDKRNEYFYTHTGFLNPSSLYYVDAENQHKKLDSLPDFFDASPYEVKQFFATSKDGTKVPYYQVSKKGVELNGKNPTLIYGYGGFEISIQPNYSSTIGMDWLEQGGVFVSTNIRGGGEYGPKWHHAALKENRMRAYEDFIAITEDVIDRKVSSPAHIGIHGRSNGGLLTGQIYTMRPDLYNAAAVGVPLLDMKRYNKLLAGASWMGEYGNPDIPEQWDYIQHFSPYHNVHKDKEYPKVFFYTSTKDDRVHPGHARKMAALMEEYGHPFYYYENTEGGHAGSSNNEQTAKVNALIYTYLVDQLINKNQ